MDLSNLKPAKGSAHGNFRRGRGHGSGNGKTAGKDTRDRKPVQELQDLDLKADRCHYTEEFQKEVLHVGIRKILWR